MIDALRQPLTALCAAIALWALGVFVLALLGLGARSGPYPDDPSLAPPLPQVAVGEASSRLGPLTDYLEVGQRPLLTPDRRPAPLGEAAGDSDAPLAAALTGVILSGEVQIALLQEEGSGLSRRVRVGELLPGTGWRLQSLQPRRAVFVGPEGEKALELRVYDGKGGAAPTPLATPAPGGAPAVAADAAPAPVAASPQAASAAPAADAAAEQQAQIEAIRRRIEARRAQMRAEAAGNAANKEDQR